MLGEMRFFADKALVVVLNQGEDAEAGDPAIAGGLPFAVINAEVEQEIAALDGDDRAMFLEEYGLEEPASERLTRVAYESLDLISFFTMGEDEVRAWPVRRGSDAVESAGKIHSDWRAASSVPR